MRKSKEELIEHYQHLMRRLNEKIGEELKIRVQAVSSSDNFYKITDRTIRQNEHQKIIEEIIDTVEEYNNLPRGSIKARLPPKIDYNKKLSNAIIALSQQGWFINYEMSPAQIYKALELLSSGDIGTLNIYMRKIVEKELSDTKDILVIRHSDRKEPLEAAFRAHAWQEFYLSIPVFLAQADGITNELINIHIFKKPNRIKKWATKTPKDEIHKIMCAALLGLENGEFHMKFNRSTFANGISRHAILHGDNSVYGNVVNSLKSISLLRYISDVVSPREVHGYEE